MALNTGQMLDSAQSLGDISSITDRVGAPSNVKRRIFTRGVGFSVGGLQAKLGVFGLAGLALLFNWIDQQIKEARAEPLWVGTAVEYGKILNDGSAHIQGTAWWDKAVRKTQRQVENNDLSEIFNLFGNPPNLKGGVSRSTLYEGQEFMNDVRAAATGAVLARMARRAAGAASARLFFGTLMSDRNPSMTIAALLQRNAMESIQNHDHIETGCLLNSIAIGSSKSEMLAKSAKGCMAAAASSGVDKRDKLVI